MSDKKPLLGGKLADKRTAPGRPIGEGDMNFKNLATGAALALGLALLGSPAAHADVILTYSGNGFTVFTPRYNSSDRVTATITLANPLGDNLNLASVTPLAFSISDGVQIIPNTFPAITSVFQFTTDDNGDITAWFINVIQTQFIDDSIIAQNFSLAISDRGQLNPQQSAMNTLAPGSWTVPSAAPVTEPPTVTVLGAGLLGLGLVWWRRRQNRDFAQ